MTGRAAAEAMRETHAAWALALVALTALRLVLAAVLPLSPDESYYWLWSVHLQPGYLDHPPMVAYWIRAGTAVFGTTPFGVRFFGPVAGGLGSLLLWDAGEALFPNRHAGLIAAALFNATLIAGVGAIIITPDTPLLFFWVAALAALSRWLATGDDRWWLAVGAAAGAALLSKYTGLLLVAGIGLWAVSGAGTRARLRSIWPWAGLLLAVLIFAPDVYWNAQHGWASYVKQGGRVAGFDAARAADFLAELVFGQIALATPGIFALAAFGLWRLRKTPDATSRLLLWLTLLPAAVFFEHVLTGRVEGNWPAVIYPSLCLAGAALPESLTMKALRPALGLGLGITLIAYAQALAAPFPLAAAKDPAALQLAGWGGLARLAAAGKPAFITADDYATEAELAYVGPPATPVLAYGPRWRYFQLLPAPGLAGATGLLLTRRTDMPCPDLEGSLIRHRGGAIVMTYRICRIAAPAGAAVLPRP